MKIETIQRDKNELCDFCNHPWSHHHKGCNKCHAVPSTHGNYCENFLCACVDFMEATLSDEDVEAFMEEHEIIEANVMDHRKTFGMFLP